MGLSHKRIYILSIYFSYCIHLYVLHMLELKCVFLSIQYCNLFFHAPSNECKIAYPTYIKTAYFVVFCC